MVRKTEYKRGFHWLYLWSICYIIIVYSFPILFFTMENDVFRYLALPLIIGVINFIIAIVGRNKIDRQYFLDCSVIIKYALIPFYIVGCLDIIMMTLSGFFMAALSAIIPISIVGMIGPVLALVMALLGWISMIGVAPFSMSYMIKSYKEGVHGKFITVAGCICQFFFMADVIAIMILSFKEKKFVKSTVALFIFYVIMVFAVVIWLAAKILGTGA